MKKVRNILLLLVLFCLVSLNAAKPAKYVFLMIGDGMGPGTLKLYNTIFPRSNFVSFPTQIPTGTNNVHNGVTDSAASGTALACGFKTYNKAIGVDKNGVPRSSLARRLQARNWKIGIISSVGINDATPGAHYANRLSRKERAGILADLLASNFDFFGISKVLGYPDSTRNELTKLLRRNGYVYANGNKLNTLRPGARNVFISDTTVEGIKKSSVRLADVTARAAELLSADGSSFFIMVEGGAIDHCNHRNDSAFAMREMIEFDAAVAEALKFAAKHPEETLVVVTADHDTGGLEIDDLSGLNKDFYKQQIPTMIEISVKLEGMRKNKSAADKMIAYVISAAGLGKVNAAEAAALSKACELFLAGKSTKSDRLAASMGYGKYNPLAVEVLRIRDKRNGFHYTTFSHSARKVITMVQGAGAENFTAPLENSDIPHRIAAAAGFPGMLEKELTLPPFPVRKNVAESVDVYRVTTDSVTLHYGFNTAAKRVFTLSTGATQTVSDFYGQITFGNLKPDTAYSIKFNGKEYKFRTPKKAKGKLLFKAGIISDPHLTGRPDIPTRMHSRSVELTGELVNRFNKAGADFIFVPGDLTDKGLPGELLAAKQAFAKAKMKLLCTFGNHDHVSGKTLKTWNKLFGAPAGLIIHNGVQIAWLNTREKRFDIKENLAVINKINENMPLIIFCHHQIFPDGYISKKDKTSTIYEMRGKASVAEAPATVKPLLEKISRCRAFVLVGHKNVASTVRVGKALQMNMPQVTEYPAGAAMLEVYEDGCSFTFEPIANRFAEEYTRRRVGESASRLRYRTRYNLLWNQFIAW